MARPIVVVKENPGKLVVEVRLKHGAKEDLVAVLKLPQVSARLRDGAKINGKPVEAGSQYRIELAEAGPSSTRKKGKKKAKKKARKSY